jgi:hypothetical protein
METHLIVRGRDSYIHILRIKDNHLTDDGDVSLSGLRGRVNPRFIERLEELGQLENLLN